MILIYINATSMTCNGIMTLCKHRLTHTHEIYSSRPMKTPMGSTLRPQKLTTNLLQKSMRLIHISLSVFDLDKALGFLILSASWS